MREDQLGAVTYPSANAVLPDTAATHRITFALGSTRDMAWLRPSSCTLANDLQKCSGRVRRDPTSARAGTKPTESRLLFCRTLCILLRHFSNPLDVFGASA